MENENLEQSTPSEVVDDTPVVEPVEDTTSNDTEPENDTEAESEEVNENTDERDAEPELILGKYKSIEEAEEGLKNRQSMLDKREAEAIKQRDEKIQAYEQMLQQQGYSSPEQYQDAVIEHKLQTEAQHAYDTIQYGYNMELARLNKEYEQGQLDDNTYSAKYHELNQILAREQMTLEQRVEATRKQRYTEKQEQQRQAEEAYKKGLYEAHPEDKALLDLFFDANPTVDKAKAYAKQVSEQAVEAYKASLATEQQNSNDIGRLQTAVDAGSPKVDTRQKTFTELEIAAMTPAEFQKYEKQIDAQYGY